MTVIHPNLGAAYALLARVYLQMQDYTEALRYADLALDQNSALYDWNAYYDDHIAAIENPDDYTGLPTPTDYSYVENYYFRCGNGSPNYTTNELDIPVWRAERFEEGDAKFMSRWKYRSENQDTYYDGVGNGYFNWGGLTTLRGIPHQGRVSGPRWRHLRCHGRTQHRASDPYPSGCV